MKGNRKLEILSHVSDAGSVTARDVSDAPGIEVHDARGLLSRYHRQGLTRK